MADTMTPDEVQATLQGYLTAATTTGELRGTKVEFTADGEHWQELLTLAEGEHPLAARAHVARAGWDFPTVHPELWNEVVPAEESWRALWHSRPHVLFGAHVLRAALRRTFADILGDRREPDDLPSGTPAPAPTPVADAEQSSDWFASIAAAETADEVRELRATAKDARAFEALSPAENARLRSAFADRWAELSRTAASASADTGTHARPQPQDHLPAATNRAGRRAQARRKKGGRR